jgi:hypothetical protein
LLFAKSSQPAATVAPTTPTQIGSPGIIIGRPQ